VLPQSSFPTRISPYVLQFPKMKTSLMRYGFQSAEEVIKD
jgi:hypothetical protein